MIGQRTLGKCRCCTSRSSQKQLCRRTAQSCKRGSRRCLLSWRTYPQRTQGSERLWWGSSSQPRIWCTQWHWSGQVWTCHERSLHRKRTAATRRKCPLHKRCIPKPQCHCRCPRDSLNRCSRRHPRWSRCLESTWSNWSLRSQRQCYSPAHTQGIGHSTDLAHIYLQCS